MNNLSSPLITTIIPTYRRPELLRRAIRSVLNQTYPKLQVCVYDNASGDKTEDTVAGLAQKDPRVKYHCHPKNIGALANFNYGMSNVTTPYFSLLSDDDILLPHFFQTALDIFHKHPEAGFVALRVVRTSCAGEVLRRRGRQMWQEGLYSPYEGLLTMIKNRPPTWTGMLFRAKVLKSVGRLDAEVGFASDFDFTFRIAAHYPYYVSSEPGAIFIIYPTHGVGTTRFETSWQKGWDKMIEGIMENTPLSVREEAKTLLIELNKSRLMLWWRLSFGEKDYDKAIEIADLLLAERFQIKRQAGLMRLVALLCKKGGNVFRIAFNMLLFVRKKLYQFFRASKPPPELEVIDYSKYLQL